MSNLPTDKIAKLNNGPAVASMLPPSSPIITLENRLSSFRSLGGNCEFGFVQRYGGVEPSGLLRFAFTPIADLTHCLDTDFSEYGVPGDLRLEISESNTYYCASARYNIWSNTTFPVGSIDPDELLNREYGRVAYLKRRMLEELASGTKIFVRKSGLGETPEEIERLAVAINRHGSSCLLWVDEAGSTWQPEPVIQIGEKVFYSRVRKFAPLETAWDVDVEPWIRVCDRAYAEVFGFSEANFYPDSCSDELIFAKNLRRHKSKRHENSLTSYTRAVDSASLDPEKIYTFSSWVWIPLAADPKRIFAVAGHERFRSHDADLGIRDRWQRVWAAGRFRRGIGPAAVGLGAIGAKRDNFWSRGARFYEGTLPRPDQSPAPLKKAYIRWLNHF